MLILTIRTDNPEAEIGLCEADKQIDYYTWHAHRELSVTLLQKIQDILQKNGKQLHDVQGVIGFAGPGSFTGLRIGLTVVNTLGYGLQVPVIATQGENWREEGVSKLTNGKRDTIALPEYGAPVHITQQKK